METTSFRKKLEGVISAFAVQWAYLLANDDKKYGVKKANEAVDKIISLIKEEDIQYECDCECHSLYWNGKKHNGYYIDNCCGEEGHVRKLK